MSLKRKIAVIVIVLLAAGFVLVISNLNLPLRFQEEPADLDDGVDTEITVDTTDETEFRPADDPYTTLVDAIEVGKPVLIKFYARW